MTLFLAVSLSSSDAWVVRPSPPSLLPSSIARTTEQKKKGETNDIDQKLFWSTISQASPRYHQRKNSLCISVAAAAGSKFSQAAFSQNNNNGKNDDPKQNRKNQQQISKKPASPEELVQQYNSRRPSNERFGGDSQLGTLHERRVKTAGRVGTKRYINPCKVFLGNLPFDATERELSQWLEQKMGLPAPILINDLKIIRDWKTSNSKGYGFCVFTEPHHATVCMTTCNGLKLNGRAVRIDQGVKKQPPIQVFMEEKKEAPVDGDEEAIQAGIKQATGKKVWRPDPEELALLRHLDPDLADEYYAEFNDEELFEVGTDEDDDEVDGVWYGDDDEEEELGDTDADGDDPAAPMNRQQRREAGRRQKKKKKKATGFGK